MSNPAFMSVCFEGEQRELRSLYGKMKRLQERKKPLVENGFYYPTRWLGNLVTSKGVVLFFIEFMVLHFCTFALLTLRFSVSHE